MKKTSGVLWGAGLIAVGVILTLNALGVMDVNVFFPGWWTLFIIVPCAIALVEDEDKMGSVIGLAVGVCLLLGCLGVFAFSLLWKLLLPIVLVGIGIGLIVRVTQGRTGKKEGDEIREGEIVEEAGEDRKEYWSVFGGQKISYKGKKFSGCQIEAVFGGIELDLRGAKLQKGARLKASSVCGGLKVLVDPEVKVETNSSCAFGGVKDSREAAKEMNGGVLTIDATCVFGGLEIK